MSDSAPQEQEKKFDLEAQGLRYASFNSRIFAALIDLLFSTFLVIALVQLRPLFFSPPPIDSISRLQLGVELSADDRHQLNSFFIQVLFENLLQIVFLSAVVVLFWIWYEGTPGKMLMKMRIVDAETGNTPTKKQLIKRVFGYIFSMLPLGFGFFWVAISKRRQGLHDIFAGTVVVQDNYFGWRYVYKISVDFLVKLNKKLKK